MAGSPGTTLPVVGKWSTIPIAHKVVLKGVCSTGNVMYRIQSERIGLHTLIDPPGASV